MGKLYYHGSDILTLTKFLLNIKVKKFSLGDEHILILLGFLFIYF